MATYIVEISAVVAREYTIEAEDKQKAMDMAEERLMDDMFPNSPQCVQIESIQKEED